MNDLQAACATASGLRARARDDMGSWSTGRRDSLLRCASRKVTASATMRRPMCADHSQFGRRGWRASAEFAGLWLKDTPAASAVHCKQHQHVVRGSPFG